MLVEKHIEGPSPLVSALVGEKQSGGGVVLGEGMAGIIDAATLSLAMDGAPLFEHLWKGNEVANASDLIGSVDLSDVSTPTHGHTDPEFNEDLVAMSGADALQAADASTMDPVGGRLAFLIVCADANNFAGTRTFMGKGNPVAFATNGYELIVTSSNILRALIDTGSNQYSATLTSWTAQATFGALCIFDTNLTTDAVKLYSTFGNATGTGPGDGRDFSNAFDEFRIGDDGLSGMGQDFAIAAVLTGPDVASLTQAHADALWTHLGIA